MHQITYTKHFISGPLAGLAVNCGYSVLSDLCCRTQQNLNCITADEPAAEALTGFLYWVSGVSCREMTATEASTTLSYDHVI